MLALLGLYGPNDQNSDRGIETCSLTSNGGRAKTRPNDQNSDRGIETLIATLGNLFVVYVRTTRIPTEELKQSAPY